MYSSLWSLNRLTPTLLSGNSILNLNLKYLPSCPFPTNQQSGCVSENPISKSVCHLPKCLCVKWLPAFVLSVFVIVMSWLEHTYIVSKMSCLSLSLSFQSLCLCLDFEHTLCYPDFCCCSLVSLLVDGSSSEPPRVQMWIWWLWWQSTSSPTLPHFSSPTLPHWETLL